jgi:hypothetical protein
LTVESLRINKTVTGLTAGLDSGPWLGYPDRILADKLRDIAQPLLTGDFFR